MQRTYAGGGDAFVAVVNALTPTAFLKYSTFVGNDPNFPTVCEDCSAALKEMLG